jgi:hypothetical protein
MTRLRAAIICFLIGVAAAVVYAQQPVNLLQFNGSAIAIGQGTMAASIPVVLASNQASIPVTQGLATSGGYSLYHAVCAASTNTANIKASAGQIYGVRVYDNVLYPVYVKFYNTAGTPTAGTGVVETYAQQAGTGSSELITSGRPYATGIGISITKGITDADTTSTAASDCVVDVYFN